MLDNTEIYNELKTDFKNDKSKNKIGFITIIVLLVLIAIPVCFLLYKMNPHSLVSSFDNLPDPTQSSTTWSVEMTAFWRDLKIDFISDFDIYWNVISIKKFNSVSDLSDKISPFDFVLWWWFMWIQDNIDKFLWSEDLWSFIVFGDLIAWNDSWLNEVWWNLSVISKYSNNRLIPWNKKSKIALAKIREWDLIRIKWFLSHVYLVNGGFDFWPSCDVKNYWCNVIYVTDVSWLKEK